MGYISEVKLHVTIQWNLPHYNWINSNRLSLFSFCLFFSCSLYVSLFLSIPCSVSLVYSLNHTCFSRSILSISPDPLLPRSVPFSLLLFHSFSNVLFFSKQWANPIFYIYLLAPLSLALLLVLHLLVSSFSTLLRSLLGILAFWFRMTHSRLKLLSRTFSTTRSIFWVRKLFHSFIHWSVPTCQTFDGCPEILRPRLMISISLLENAIQYLEVCILTAIGIGLVVCSILHGEEEF